MEWIDTWVDMAKHVYHVCSTLRIVFHICFYENMYSRIWAGTFHMACTKPVSSKLPAFALVDSNRAYWKNRVFGFGANLGVWCDTRVQNFFPSGTTCIPLFWISWHWFWHTSLHHIKNWIDIHNTCVYHVQSALFKLKFT